MRKNFRAAFANYQGCREGQGVQLFSLEYFSARSASYRVHPATPLALSSGQKLEEIVFMHPISVVLRIGVQEGF